MIASSQKRMSLGTCGLAKPASHDADEERPRAERDELEDADDLVDRRVVDVLLVSVVQPVELGRDDPERQRQHHDCELSHGMLRRSRRTRTASRADTRGSGRRRRRRGESGARTSRDGAQDVDGPALRRRSSSDAVRRSSPSASRSSAVAEASWKAFTPSASCSESSDPYRTSRTSTQHPLPVESTRPRLGGVGAARPDQSRKPPRARRASRSGSTGTGPRRVLRHTSPMAATGSGSELWSRLDALIRGASDGDVRSHRLEVFAARLRRAAGRTVPEDFLEQERAAAMLRSRRQS